MMKLFELWGEIKIDDNDSEETLKKNDKQAKSLGETLSGAGKKVGKAGMVIGGAMTVIAAGATAATAAISENTDRIDKGAQNIGFSTDAYQEWEFVLSQSGGSIESLTAGMGTLSKQVVDGLEGSKTATDAFAKLGIEVDDLSGLTQEEIFEKTISGLQGLEEGAERTALANELLGRSGKEMGALLNSTGTDIDNMKQQANDLGAVLSEDTVAAGVAMTDSIDQMKRTLIGTLTEALAPMIPTIMDLMQTFVEILPPILELIKPLIEKLVPVFTKIIDKLLPPLISLFDALMPVLMPLIDIFVELLDTALLPLIEAFLPLIEVLLPPLATLLEALMPLITGVANIIANVLVLAVDNLTSAFDWLMNALQPTFDLLKKIGEMAGDVLGGAGDFIGGIGGGVGDFFGGVGDALGLPSFAVGTSYVPEDMIAQIHKGERILTAEENKSFSGGAGNNIVFNIYDPQIMGDDAMEVFTDKQTSWLRSRGVLV